MSLQLGNAYKWIKEGIGHYNAKRYKECLDACERAIRLNPDCKEAHYGKGLALAQQKRYGEALIAYQKASHLAPESAKIYAAMAELYYNVSDYEKSGLSYKRAIQLDSQFEAVYAERLKMLLDKASGLHATYRYDPYRCDLAISAFREVLIFNPDNVNALTEIKEIQREVDGLRSCPIRYTGKLIYTSKRANSASISLCSGQSDEKVRIFLMKSVKDSDTQTNGEYSLEYFSRSADGWRISITFPLLETDFRVEVLRNETIIAYGYYWVKNGYLGRSKECNMYLTIAYKPAGRSSEEGSNNRDSNSTIYVPDRTGGRSRRVRRGS